MFGTRARMLVKQWQQQPDGSPVNVNSVMAALTLDIIGLSGFGYQFNALEEPNSPIREAYGTVGVGVARARFRQCPDCRHVTAAAVTTDCLQSVCCLLTLCLLAVTCCRVRDAQSTCCLFSRCGCWCCGCCPS